MSETNGTVTQLVREEIESSPSVTIAPEAVAHVQGLVSGKRLPKRIVTFPLPAPYDDFSVTAWVNFSQELAEELRSQDIKRGQAALLQIVCGHDLVDFNGKPFPPADDPRFWQEIPNDLAAVIVNAINSQVGRLTPTNAAR